MKKIYEMQFIDVENNEILKSEVYDLEDEIQGTIIEFKTATTEGQDFYIVDSKNRLLAAQYQSSEQILEGNRKIYKACLKVQVEDEKEVVEN